MVRRISWILAALICGPLLAGCLRLNPRLEAAQSVPGEVAFQMAGPGGAAMVVPVKLNGKGPFKLVLDTGATLTCLDDDLARRLNLPKIPARAAGVGVGGSGPVKLVRVQSLEVGTATANGLTACTLDLHHLKRLSPEVEGLLGLNFLKSYRVTLDFDRRIMSLEE